MCYNEYISKNMKKSIAGIPWYEREDYPALLELFTDSDSAFEIYDEWLKAAKILKKQSESQGMPVVKVRIRPDEFKKWCEEQGMAPDIKARNRFASLAAGRHYRSH